MSKSLSQNMPSLATPSEISSKTQNMAVEDSTVTNPNAAADVKKIVLLKRNPSTTINNSNPQTSVGNNTLISSIDLTQTPCRSNSSSPNLDIDLTPEQSANLNEIDFNTGLDGFLLAALKNPKDRLFLLKLDREMERFINDKSHNRLEFPPMNSYQRLIVHRVAQYFKLSHVVDNSGKAVVLYKSAETYIPILRFSDLLEQEEEKPEKSVKIMRRQQINPQKVRSTGDSDSNSEGERKILTIEEREAAYQKARARIFKDLEQKNGESEQDESEGTVNSTAITNNFSNNNNNEQQNIESTSSSKTKNSSQNKVTNTNNTNNKNGKPSQQTSKPIGNNKNSNKNGASNAKNRQQQPSRLQPFNYNPSTDRSIFLPKQGRPIGNFSGPPPIMPPGPFGPPFFNGHVNMYDVNMVPLQPPILPPEMQVCHPMGNPYVNIHHEWNPTLAGPYNRPNTRNVWGPEAFNAPTEIGGNPSLFNHQQNSTTSFLPPRPSAQSEVRPQVHNNLKHLNQYPSPHYSQTHGSAHSENNHLINSPASPMESKPNKSPSASPSSPMSQSGFDSSNSLWANKGQWSNVSGGEDSKLNNERQLDQKRPNNRSSTFVPSSQQREVPFFNPVWNNNSDSAMNVFNTSQASAEYPTQNTSGVPLIHPPIYPGIAPPISGPNTGPRRNNNGNHIIPGPIPQEYASNVQRFPPTMVGFPAQSTPQGVTGAIRPPKSTELFDPNNPSVSSTQNTNLPATVFVQSSVSQPPSTSTSVPSSSRSTSHASSSKSTSASSNKASSSSSWTGPPVGNKVVSLPQNPNNGNSRRKNVTELSNNSNNNAIVDGTMMRSLSISSNSSQQGRTHHRPPSTSPSGNGKKKESGLLFDYSMQVPYEGVKPSEANEPPQPSHIIELYDFSESDNLMDISFSNATIKQIFHANSPGKRPTILAIFKNSREANKAMQNHRGVRFKIKTWELLVKNGGNMSPLISVGEQSSNPSITSHPTLSLSNKTNIEDSYEKHHQELMNATHGLPLNGKQ